MNEDYWYYEEQQENGEWYDAFAGYKLNKTEAVSRMELRKQSVPSAKLRLVHVTRERFSYRNRHKAT